MIKYIPILLVLLTSCGVFKPSPKKAFKTGKQNAPYDVIIVPGVPYNDSTWSTTMKMRVYWSKYLFERGYAKNIIYSGSAVYSEYSECKVMALYAEELGIPKENIFIEDEAEHSTENTYYSYRIAKQNGFDKIALATDPFQTNSLRKFIKKHELPIEYLPVVFDTLTATPRLEPEIDPSSAIKENFIAVTERETFFTRLGGTIGKHIVWYKSDLKKERLIKKYRRKGRLIE